MPCPQRTTLSGIPLFIVIPDMGILGKHFCSSRA